jgi:(1->4)-alpha-D-glucan 1-alpha-D-glucosylmutase
MTSLAPHPVNHAPLAEPEWLSAEIDQIVARVTERITAQRLPVSTYRLQLNAQLTFPQAQQLTEYLTRLGISDVYASPLLRARSGSSHGYDVVAHGELNPEIGTRAEFDAFCGSLQQAGLGLILDIVPNHMAACPMENAWWWDVLENGPSSTYAAYFDIDWSPVKPDLQHHLLLPVLGDQFGVVLEAGQLTVNRWDGEFRLHYFDQQFPLDPCTYSMILQHRLEELLAALGHVHPLVVELLSILTAIGNLPAYTETAGARVQERLREKEVVKRRLRSLLAESAEIADFVVENLRQINGQAGDARSFDRLDELLERQVYRLAYWRVAADEINYRRFFDINGLAAISMERPEVFEAAHQLVFELIDRGQVTGLRIDHPDGLFDPPGYLLELQERRFLQLARATTTRPEEWPALEQRLGKLWRSAGSLAGAPLSRPLYIVVEKILERGEEVPADWLTHGTVGYEFLSALNGLWVNPAGTKLCTTTYARLTGDTLGREELAHNCKRLIVRRSMASELTVLAHRLDRISERNRRTRDFTLNSLVHALEEVISHFDVYRTYVRSERVLERDRGYIEAAVAKAMRRNPTLSASIFEFIRDTLLLQLRESADEQERRESREFVGKFQQLTGPIMAKAMEDTAFYRFNRLVALNEVGGEPQQFGTPLATFHALNAARLPQHARSLSTTSTHDTKRGEDTRARIAVLSEVSREWRALVSRWVRQNARFKTDIDGQLAPSRSDEYLLYQTLIGIWPSRQPDETDLAPFVQRVQEYMFKVAHEAKTHTSWTNPHKAYDAALQFFVERLFQHRGRSSFLASLDGFAQRVAEHGRWNSLSQTVLKIASPGAPDIYQGTELWALTLVDPDNRRLVDFAARRIALEELSQRLCRLLDIPQDGDALTAWFERCDDGAAPTELMTEFLNDLVDTRSDGRIKLFTTWLALRARRRDPELFADGAYLDATAQGQFAENVVAFARTAGSRRLLVMAPRWTVGVSGFGGSPPLGDRWGDTTVSIPVPAKKWTNLFTGRQHELVDGKLPVSTVMTDFPVALLFAAKFDSDSCKSAG